MMAWSSSQSQKPKKGRAMTKEIREEHRRKAKARWNALPDDEKARRKARLQPFPKGRAQVERFCPSPVVNDTKEVSGVGETKENTDRMEKCPSFEHCDAPRCPLDELYEHRVAYPEDPVCVAEKPTRYHLGKSLPRRGMFPIEWAAYLRFYGTAEEVDKALKERFEKPFETAP